MYSVNSLFPVFQYTECVHSWTFQMCKVGELQYAIHEVPVMSQEGPPSSLIMFAITLCQWLCIYANGVYIYSESNILSGH